MLGWRVVAFARLRKHVAIIPEIAVQAELKAVRKELKDLLDAWNTATGVVRFVKWLSTLVAAIAVITAAFKGFSGR